MTEKIQLSDPTVFYSDEQKIDAIKEAYRKLGDERDSFLGYIQIKLGISNAKFYNKMRGVTNFTKAEIEPLTTILGEKAWRRV